MGDSNCSSESLWRFDWASVDNGICSEGPDLNHVAPILPPCGQKAIFKVKRHAKKMFQGITDPCLLRDEDISPLQQSTQRLSPEDALKVTKYLTEKAPIVVHFKPEDILSSLLEDGVYRNLFETGTSNGNTDISARSIWEWTTFEGAYNNALPEDRPKYGVLNTMNDPRGVYVCTKNYGRAYLVLKNQPEVRGRVTFSDQDTSHRGCVCVDCNPNHMMLLMLNMNTMDLNQVLEVASGRKVHGSSFFSHYYNTKLLNYPYIGYNEAQIHGPLRLAHDIEKIVLDETYKEEMTPLLEDIKAKYSVPYEWQSFKMTPEEEIYQSVIQFHIIKQIKMWSDAFSLSPNPEMWFGALLFWLMFHSR